MTTLSSWVHKITKMSQNTCPIRNLLKIGEGKKISGWFLNQYKVPNNENITELSLVWNFGKFRAKIVKMSQKLCPGTNHDVQIMGYKAFLLSLKSSKTMKITWKESQGIKQCVCIFLQKWLNCTFDSLITMSMVLKVHSV